MPALVSRKGLCDPGVAFPRRGDTGLNGASGITRFFHLANHTHLASLAIKAQDGVSAGVDQRHRSGLDVTAHRIANADFSNGLVLTPKQASRYKPKFLNIWMQNVSGLTG